MHFEGLGHGSARSTPPTGRESDPRYGDQPHESVPILVRPAGRRLHLVPDPVPDDALIDDDGQFMGAAEDHVAVDSAISRAAVARLLDRRVETEQVRAFQPTSTVATAIRLPRGQPDVGLLRDWLGPRRRTVEVVDDAVVVFDRVSHRHLEILPGEWLVALSTGALLNLADPVFRQWFEPLAPTREP